MSRLFSAVSAVIAVSALTACGGGGGDSGGGSAPPPPPPVTCVAPQVLQNGVCVTPAVEGVFPTTTTNAKVTSTMTTGAQVTWPPVGAPAPTVN